MLREELNLALKEAMKAKDQRATATLRLILAGLKDRDIQARSAGNSDGVSDDEILAMLQKMVRQRNDSIEIYDQAGRQELVDKEREEIEVIERFLPKMMDESETESAVKEVINELGAESVKDMGKVMGALKERYAGKMDFSLASQQVKQALI